MNMNRWVAGKETRQRRVCKQVKAEMLADIDGYVDLWVGTATLDDDYTAAELRHIADALDEVARRIESEGE